MVNCWISFGLLESYGLIIIGNSRRSLLTVYILTRKILLFMRDNRTYFCSSGVQLELYTLQRDRALDDRVRTVLDAADIPYEVQFAWIESEGLYETIFEIEV